MKSAAATALRLVAQEPETIPAYTPPPADIEPQPMGRIYIRNGYPMRGAPVDQAGRMWLLLECYRIPQGSTSGEIGKMQVTKDQAQYIRYYGKVSRAMKDEGLTIGYVEHCYGVPQNFAGMDDISDMTITKFAPSLDQRPKAEYDTSLPRFGQWGRLIEDMDGIIAAYAAADRARAPKRPQSTRPRNVC